MLLQRILTALILIPLAVAGVLQLTTPLLALLLGAILLLGGWEWTRLAGIDSAGVKVAYLILLALGMACLYQMLPYPAAVFWLFAAASLWWLGVTVALLRYRPGSNSVPGAPYKSLFGLLVLLPAWSALVALHQYADDGPLLVLYALALSWVADTSAYFTGLRWGRNKLAPAISPGKTREGVYGALVGVALWGALLAWLRPQTGPFLLVVISALLVCLVSVVGDLFESLLKREAGVKDSGTLLPGHGGVLDRIDSLTAVAPVFLFLLMLLERAG